MALNGRLPASDLAPIAGGQLRKDAALRWNAMNYSRRKNGLTTILPNGPQSSYRTYNGQVLMRNMWCGMGKCGNAAIPGTSNHGWGLAVDANNPAGVSASGAPYGYQKRWSDASWEPWHFKWAGFGSTVGGAPTAIDRVRENPLRLGSKSTDVRDIQIWLRRGGYIRRNARIAKNVGTMGPATVSAVKRFQRHVGLTADGIVGPKTYAAIRRRWIK
jgi:hypothetical protein